MMSISSKNIFLIDGIGALITASLLILVLAPLESYFGMPKNVLWLLSAIAIVFASYSLACHFVFTHQYKRYLKVIIVANLIYCLTTFLLVLIHFQSLTWFGIVYFLGEIQFIAFLLIIESKVMREQSLRRHGA